MDIISSEKNIVIPFSRTFKNGPLATLQEINTNIYLWSFVEMEYSAVLRAYSWFNTKGSFLKGFRESYAIPEIVSLTVICKATQIITPKSFNNISSIINLCLTWESKCLI